MDEHFNSIKVQLELFCFVYSDYYFVYFNSIKVQLEHRVEAIEKLGTIFQFHKGTIRTTIEISIYWGLFHFNSIKVQLEPKPAETPNHLLQFQFHKGTIRTKFNLIACVCNVISIP